MAAQEIRMSSGIVSWAPITESPEPLPGAVPALSPGSRNVYENVERPYAVFGPDVPLDDHSAAMHRSMSLTPNPVSIRFFSRENVDLLQAQLRDLIRQRMGYTIDRQSDQQMLIVMRYVYVQSGANDGGDAEVQRLNRLVLKEIAPQVASGIMQYLGYLRDASTLPVPVPRAQATSIKGQNTLELFKGM